MVTKYLSIRSNYLGNFVYSFNVRNGKSISVNTSTVYTDKNVIQEEYPSVNFDVTIFVGERFFNSYSNDRLHNFGFTNVKIIPLNYDDIWTINDVSYRVYCEYCNGSYCLFIEQSGSNSRALLSYLYDNTFSFPRVGYTDYSFTYIPITYKTNGFGFHSVICPITTSYLSIEDSSEELLYNFYLPASEDEPVPPIPVSTDAGKMWMSNTASLSYYHFTYNNFSELRRALWARNFLDLFSQYNNKASLIPVCHIYPIKIHPFESYTSEIIIGDGETISTECFALNVEQDLGDDNRTLIAHFTLLEYPKLNNYIDYPTVTEYKLFLPFIGFINIDFQYLNKGLDIYYFLDYSTGYAVCNINSGDVRINEIDIQLAQEIILAGGDNSAWKQSIWGVVGAVAGLGVMAATGNILASTATYSGIKTISTVQQEPVVSKEIKQYHGGNQLSRKETLYKGNGTQTIVREEQPHTVKYTHGLTPYYLARSVNAFSDLAAMEQGITVNSSTNPNSFFNSYIHPYLLIRRPTTNIDISKFRKLEGQPLNDVRRLIDITGYTEVGNIHVDIDAYEEEISEISEILMGGVIINAH